MQSVTAIVRNEGQRTVHGFESYIRRSELSRASFFPDRRPSLGPVLVAETARIAEAEMADQVSVLRLDLDRTSELGQVFGAEDVDLVEDGFVRIR